MGLQAQSRPYLIRADLAQSLTIAQLSPAVSDGTDEGDLFCDFNIFQN